MAGNACSEKQPRHSLSAGKEEGEDGDWQDTNQIDGAMVARHWQPQIDLQIVAGQTARLESEFWQDLSLDRALDPNLETEVDLMWTFHDGIIDTVFQYQVFAQCR